MHLAFLNTNALTLVIEIDRIQPAVDLTRIFQNLRHIGIEVAPALYGLVARISNAHQSDRISSGAVDFIGNTELHRRDENIANADHIRAIWADCC